jgi:hypothetical protein
MQSVKQGKHETTGVQLKMYTEAYFKFIVLQTPLVVESSINKTLEWIPVKHIWIFRYECFTVCTTRMSAM